MIHESITGMEWEEKSYIIIYKSEIYYSIFNAQKL